MREVDAAGKLGNCRFQIPCLNSRHDPFIGRADGQNFNMGAVVLYLNGKQSRDPFTERRARAHLCDDVIF